MRSLWLILCPMIAAAGLVVWGGERLSRRVVEDRVPADRTKLLDFSATLRDELDRLDTLYDAHLSRLAAYSDSATREQLGQACSAVAGIRVCHVFDVKEKLYEVNGAAPAAGAADRLPYVEMEGGKTILNPARTVVLPKTLWLGNESSGWIATAERGFRVHWRLTQAGKLVAFTIDDTDLGNAMAAHLEPWMEVPFAPLRDGGEIVSLTDPNSRKVGTKPAPEEAGAASLVIPHRTALGEWQVVAWDRRSFHHTHHMMTLAVSGGIAGALLLIGGFLCVERNRAVRLAEERVSFVNRVSHELGTPLTNILLNLDLASRALGGKPEETKKRLALVEEEVRRMGRLVANVLTFSRNERKTMQLHAVPCVADEVIGGVIAQFQPSLDRRKITVEWQRGAGDRVLMDTDTLAQIIGNLVSNVEKYAGSGGWLGITSAWGNDRLTVRVEDRGPGIPQKHAARIFEAFERVHHGLSEGSSGTGLGLSIARELARKIGGELMLVSATAETRDTQGAVFVLDLPAPSAANLISMNEAKPA